MANEMINEAFQFQRQRRNTSNASEMLQYFFERAEALGKLDLVLQFSLNAVEESELPLLLPELEDFQPGDDPAGPLARAADWRFFERDGEPERSAIWHRLLDRDEYRMPPLASLIADDVALARVGSWIASLESCN